MGKRLFRATVIVSAMTLLSRLLGFVRDMLIARLFGADVATDAFFVAFKIPNLLRRLFSEGAFSHALIPAMEQYWHDKTALREFIGKTAGTLAAWALLMTTLAMALAPVLVLIIAPGFAWQGEQYDLTVTALRGMLPFGFCIVMVAYAGSVQNLHNHYVIPALTPILLNVCMIYAALRIAPQLDIPIMALTWGCARQALCNCSFKYPVLCA